MDWITSPVGAVVAAAITVVIVALVAFGGGDDDKPAAPAQVVNPPDPVSAAELASLSESLGQPVYWAGRQGGSKEYELTRQGNERITVRYPAAAGGDAAQGSLTVGTYRLDDASDAIRRAADGATAKLYRLPRGGLAVSDTSRPTNVYLAYPKQPYQVEVFDPKPGRALKLVLRGRVKPVR
jgi:hypothetical protein